MSDLSDLSSDEDVPQKPLRRPRVFRQRNDPMDQFSDAEFTMRYRFSKNGVRFLLDTFGGEIEPRTMRNCSISAILKICLTLRFYATGAFQQLVGDDIRISKQSACRTIRIVTHHIGLMKGRFVNMPQSKEEINDTKLQFFQIHQFPDVLGAIDCMHVKIQSPGGPHPKLFRNQKGYFSINVEVVCDALLRAMSIIARFPGSINDSTIFNEGPLRARLEQGEFGNSYLLGDNGYACCNHLLTPILNPSNASERAYNVAHIATQNTIEQCFGVVKRRFPCLSLGLRLKMETNLAVIVACFTLHNIGSFLKEEEPPHDPNLGGVLKDNDVEVPIQSVAMPDKRNELLATVFARS